MPQQISELADQLLESEALAHIDIAQLDNRPQVISQIDQATSIASYGLPCAHFVADSDGKAKGLTVYLPGLGGHVSHQVCWRVMLAMRLCPGSQDWLVLDSPSHAYKLAASSDIYSELVRSYVQKIISLDPPDITIIGYSQGAVIALDLARELQARGMNVQHLALADPTVLDRRGRMRMMRDFLRPRALFDWRSRCKMHEFYNRIQRVGGDSIGSRFSGFWKFPLSLLSRQQSAVLAQMRRNRVDDIVLAAEAVNMTVIYAVKSCYRPRKAALAKLQSSRATVMSLPGERHGWFHHPLVLSAVAIVLHSKDSKAST